MMKSQSLTPPARSTLGRLALIAIEILLVLAIIGLLLAIWLPAIIGANPDAAPMQ